MSLDGTLEGRYPGVALIIARDKAGRVQGFHRYATAGARHRGDPRCAVASPRRAQRHRRAAVRRHDRDAREQGAQRLSLAFAAFPEIFTDKNRNLARSLVFTAVHLGDPLIALESLYRYLRKFHALGDRRYVMATLTQVVPLLIVLLSLEFMPRRRHLTRASLRAGVVSVTLNWSSTVLLELIDTLLNGFLVRPRLGQAVHVVGAAHFVESPDGQRR